MYVRPFASQFFRAEKRTWLPGTSIPMKIHLRSGTELYTLIVFNVSRDAYRRRVVLRAATLSEIHTCVDIHTFANNSRVYLCVRTPIKFHLRYERRVFREKPRKPLE